MVTAGSSIRTPNLNAYNKYGGPATGEKPVRVE